MIRRGAGGPPGGPRLHAATRPPRAAEPGKPARADFEYERNGTANLFLVTEPLRGWRHVTVTDRRTRLDWARVIKDLVDVRYPDAQRIVLVLDNLNTHTPAALYEAFPPAEARRIVERLEIHDRGRPRQTEAALPVNRRLIG